MKNSLAWSEYCKSLASSVVEACRNTPVVSGPGALTKALAEALPDWKFRPVLVRGGWYRLGGVLSADGSRLADNLESWAVDALESCNGDFAEMADMLEGQTLYATRLVGQTHYFVAQAGDGQADFLQLEIEDLQEMRSHLLFAGEVPTSLEELIDPRVPGNQLQPVGAPGYSFRRLQHMGAFLERMLSQKPEPAPIHRMLKDWQASSAGLTSAFPNQWVLATREHLDRYQQTVFRAQPIEVYQGPLPEFAAGKGTHGVALHGALGAFDKELGYPMAWYFHMLASRAVPHWVAQAVVEDALAGFAYLPERDLAVVRNWLHQPYAV